MNIKGVIFDIGGVLAEDVWENLLPDIASDYSLDKDLVDKVGSLLWESYAYSPETQGNDWRALEERYWKQFITFFFGKDTPSGVSVSSFIQRTDNFIRPVNGMDSILNGLQSKGVGLAICSNNNEFWFRKQMDKCRLHRFFNPSKIILSCRIGVSKSSSRFEMFQSSSHALGLPGAACIFVDDRDGTRRASTQSASWSTR